MTGKIREHVEYLFQSAPRNARAVELKEELIANLCARYADLVQGGESDEAAYSTVIAGIGDVDELIRGLREQEVFNPEYIQNQRQRSAILIAGAVCLYIISFIFPIALGFLVGGNAVVIGAILMFLCWGIATALLVYNAMSKPKYVKMEETIVEDFKEWKVDKTKRNTLYKTLQSIVWMITIPLYLCLGVFFNAWHPGWLIFILAPVASQIIKLVSMYREGD